MRAVRAAVIDSSCTPCRVVPVKRKLRAKNEKMPETEPQRYIFLLDSYKARKRLSLLMDQRAVTPLPDAPGE